MSTEGLLAAAGSPGRKTRAKSTLPPWLVFAGMIRTVSMTGPEPGLNPLVTALEEEGFTDLMASHVIGSFARHFMVATDAWQESGFGVVAKVISSGCRASRRIRRDIDDNR